jgi:hypothetical protein
VDGAGSLYVAAGDKLLKFAADAVAETTAAALPFTDLDSPRGVTVNDADTVYVVDRCARGRIGCGCEQFHEGGLRRPRVR